MGLSSSSPRKTTSTSTVAMAQGAHRFEIAGYTRHKGLGVSKYVSSGTFDVGGYKWSMRFYPDGNGVAASEAGYVSAYLELGGFFGSTRASCDLRIVDPTTGASTSVYRMTEPRVFECGSDSRWAPGHPTFMKRSELEAFVHGDRLVLEFVVTVFAAPRVSKVRPVAASDLVPPPDLSSRLAKLLESNDLADVTFVVGGKAFPVHRIILAAGSPVFKAELYGAMKEKDTDHIPIEDMQPAVLQAMLHFIYTDSLPTMDMDDATGDDMSDMIQHLLVAADRYGVERLKLICEGMLCESLGPETVRPRLALADRCHCNRLKDACVEFSNLFKTIMCTGANLRETHCWFRM